MPAVFLNDDFFDLVEKHATRVKQIHLLNHALAERAFLLDKLVGATQKHRFKRCELAPSFRQGKFFVTVKVEQPVFVVHHELPPLEKSVV